MRAWFIIVDFVALFFLIIMMQTTYKRMEIYEEEYNEERLYYATEYSTEAAFNVSVAGVNAGIDYADMSNVFVTNKKTLETFDTMMALNYNMALNDTSYLAIEDSIGTMALMANDGYYITNLAETNENEYRFEWSPKLPYVYTPSDTVTYSLNLNSKKWRKVTIKSNTYTLTSGDSYSDSKTNGQLNENIRRKAISKTLTDAITNSIDNNEYIRQGADYTVYIPSTQTQTGINAVRSPTLIVILQDAGYAGVSSTENVTVAGVRVQSNVYVLGYTDSKGRKKYAYEWQGAGDVYEIERIFYSIEEAAKAGYTPDYNFMFNSAINPHEW